MSFILDGPILFGLGFAGAALARQLYDRNRWAIHIYGVVVLAVFYVTSVSAFVDADWIKPVLRPPFTLWFDWTGLSGTEWMVSSGFLPLHASWPPSKAVTFVAIIAFATYPFWLWLGYWNGRGFFGRHPRQAGLLGLLQMKVRQP